MASLRSLPALGRRQVWPILLLVTFVLLLQRQFRGRNINFGLLFQKVWSVIGHHGNWRERGCLIVMNRKRGAQEGQEQDIPWTLQWPLISSVLMFLEFFGIVPPDEYLSFNLRVGWHFSFKP